jgi:hypothetical protein
MTGHTLLDAVDWPAVIDRIGGPDTGAPARALAAAILNRIEYRPYAIHDTVAAAGPDLDEAQRLALADWLVSTAFEVAADVAVAAAPDRPTTFTVLTEAPIDHAPEAGPLILGPGVDALGLPLLDLAADVGQHHVLGRLVVTVVPAIADARAVCYPGVGLIVLRADIGAHHWPHELAHALDPALSDRSRAQGEAFADHLALLLAAHEPAAVADAAPLIRSADQDAGRRHHLAGLPDDGAPSIDAFHQIAGALVTT